MSKNNYCEDCNLSFGMHSGLCFKVKNLKYLLRSAHEIIINLTTIENFRHIERMKAWISDYDKTIKGA